MQKNKIICGLVLAAGLSSRMKAFKPLMPLRKKTLIENTIDSVLNGGAEKVVVVTGYRANELEPLLTHCYGNKIITVRNEEYAVTDMLRSIQIGCTAMPPCDAFFLLPGDMPVIRQDTFWRLCAAKNGKKAIVFPTLDGYRKHPPLIDSRFLPEILNFNENGGLRKLWEKHKDEIIEVPVDDVGVWIDLDSREDYRQCKIKYDTKQEVFAIWKRSVNLL